MGYKIPLFGSPVQDIFRQFRECRRVDRNIRRSQGAALGIVNPALQEEEVRHQNVDLWKKGNRFHRYLPWEFQTYHRRTRNIQDLRQGQCDPVGLTLERTVGTASHWHLFKGSQLCQ
jgi:hypothetical protein